MAASDKILIGRDSLFSFYEILKVSYETEGVLLKMRHVRDA